MTGRTALALLFVCLLCGRAQGHGPEQWIADENLHDPASGLFCCGPNDCKPGDPVAEFNPYSRGIPKSPDGRYHRCNQYRVHSRLRLQTGNALFHRAAAWRVIDGPYARYHSIY